MPLCTACYSLDFSNFGKSLQGIRSNSLAAVQKSALGGCDLCSLVLGIALERIPDVGDVDAWIQLSLLGNGTSSSSPPYNKLVVEISNKSRYLNSSDETVPTKVLNPTVTNHEICIAADQGSPACKSGLIGGAYLGVDKTAPEYTAAIGKWMRGCISSHKRCCQSISGGAKFDPHSVELPTRCIEVTSTASYLRETEGMVGSYVTLSHRWNLEAEIFKTTSSNYLERISGEDLGPLSKNFDTAIAVVRGLGIRYLWIDSICIIQKSEDWDLEKWKMGQYYEHALFTIAAVGGGEQQLQGSGVPDAPQADLIKSLVRVPYREDGIRKGSVYLYRPEKSTDLLFWEDVDDSELLSRGWVFQEWLLSKRIIYFTRNETFLECSSQRPGFKVDFSSRCDSGFETWYAIVRSFSTTNLTDRRDHLAAISGAAFEYGQVIQREITKGNGKGKEPQRIPNYLSGLWLQDVHHGLMWLADVVASPTCKCNAPSWSWLSCEGLIGWPTRGARAQPALQILSADCEPTPQGVDALPETVIMTVQLQVRTKMQPVLVNRGINSVFDMEVATRVCLDLEFPFRRQGKNVPLDGSGKIVSNPLYTVCHPSSPDVAGGWAMFERSPDVGEWTRTPSGTVGLAIHVASRKVGNAPGILEDWFKFGSEVCDVIFVASVGNNTFRRLGMGIICDWNIRQGFQRDESVEIVLV
ncbi:hypothetical protein ACJ41O_012132 [Fusarium nematophilum]